MIKRLLWALLLLPCLAEAQQQFLMCDIGVPCTLTGPQNTHRGDPGWLVGGKDNTNFSQVFGAFGVTGLLKGNGALPTPMTAAGFGDVTALWGGSCNSTTFLRGDGQCQPPAAGNFNNITFSSGNLNWSGVTSPNSNDTYIYGSLTATGTANNDTAPRGRLAYDYVTITSDSVQATCVICGSQSSTVAYTWRDYTVGANWLGYRIGDLTYFTLANPPATCTTNGGCPNYYSPNYVGSQQLVNLSNHMAGLPLSVNGANGAIFGGNTNIFANPGSPFDNVTGVWDWEFDIGFNSTGSAWKKIGLLVRDSGNRGLTQDNAFTVALNSGNNVGDQGTFRMVYNAGNTYAASAAMAGDSVGFGFGRRESGSTIKDTPGLYAFSAINVALTTSGCYFVSPQFCIDGNNNVNTPTLNVGAGGITQQTTTVSGINVLTSGYAFTGSVTGTTLTLTTFAPGAALGRGQQVYCPSCTPTQFYVGPILTGTGGAGSTYGTSAACTSGCGTVVAMTTGQEALGPYGYSGGMLVMADSLGQMVNFPNIIVDPSSGTTATTNGGSLVLNGLAVPNGYIPANSCAGSTPITISIPGNSGTNPTMQLTVSGGNITGATVVTPGNIPSGYSFGTNNFMTISGDSCVGAGGAGASLALSQFLVFGISGVTMNSHGTQYSCAAPPRVVLGGGHASTTETVPTFEAQLASCTTSQVVLNNGFTTSGGATITGVTTINTSGAGNTTGINSNNLNTSQVNIGNDNGATAVNSVVIAGNITLDGGGTSSTSVAIEGGASAGATTINAGTGTGNVTIGNTAGGGTTQIKGITNIAPGQLIAGGNVSILNGASTANLNIMSGTATGTTQIGNTAATVAIQGTTSINASSSTNTTNIGTGNTSGQITIGNAANAIWAEAPITSTTGTAFSVAVSGTNCTSATTSGNPGVQAGLFTVTTAAASAACTITITMLAARHDWQCMVDDITDKVHFFRTNGTQSSTTCVVSGTQTTNGTATYSLIALGN